MSSPKAGKAKSSKPAKPEASAKAAAPRDEVSGEDKAHFVKAMWEGVKRDEAPVSTPEAPELEILRRIPASTPVDERVTPESEEVSKLAAVLERKLADGELDVLTQQSFQAMMAVLCKLYSANAESGNRFPILSGRAAVTGTDAMIACGALLKAVDLQVFELGMWQSWSGM